MSPYLYSEHPLGRPADGANYLQKVLSTLWSNPAVWESTAVLINFDENDGFYDHAIPPNPPTGTPNEFINGLPIGLGPRVPMTVVSPWSTGGWTSSQVYDHTSVLQFLEKVTGVKEPNISAWRRSICGDLTQCFDFTSFNPQPPGAARHLGADRRCRRSGEASRNNHFRPFRVSSRARSLAPAGNDRPPTGWRRRRRGPACT